MKTQVATTFCFVVTSLWPLTPTFAIGKSGKLTVIHVSIASVAGRHFEVQIRPAGINSPHRRELENRVRDCAERDGDREISFHADLKIELVEFGPGQNKLVSIKSKYPKSLSSVVRCIEDDLKANTQTSP